MRGEAGRYPLDPPTIVRLGAVLARLLGPAATFVIGRDTRESGQWIEDTIIRGIERGGGQAIPAGVITTPGVAFLTREVQARAGIVLSASHNPYQDNGIKIFSPNGEKLGEEMENRIEQELASLADDIDTQDTGLHTTGETLDRSVDDGLVTSYLRFLMEVPASGLDLTGMKIAIDCANGAASQIAPLLFESLGATMEVINASPDGRNINLDCGALHPESLAERVVEVGADIGFAFDGDADRLILVDESGTVRDGDHILFVMSEYLHRRNELSPLRVVATVMSNLGLELALRERGIDLIRTAVGDKNVLDELLRGGGAIGGEQSGHIIFPDISLAGDGLSTALQLLRAVIDSRKSIGALAERMVRLPQILTNLRISRKVPLHSVPEIQSTIERLEEELAGEGRILVRYSGTENIVRIMIEGRDEKIIHRQSIELRELLTRHLNQPHSSGELSADRQSAR